LRFQAPFGNIYCLVTEELRVFLSGWLRPGRRSLANGFRGGVAGVLLVLGVAHARDLPAETTARTPVSLRELPAEALKVYSAVRTGGPFRHPKDGIVFGNRERLLAARPRGYYREYTVDTPGAHNRGARRIVCGGAQVRAPEACFYTADHYASFRKIEP
jgi:ribonuclease T1